MKNVFLKTISIITILFAFFSCKNNVETKPNIENVVIKNELPSPIETSETSTFTDDWTSKYVGVLVYDFYKDNKNDIVISTLNKKNEKENVIINFEKETIFIHNQKLAFQEFWEIESGFAPKWFEVAPSFFHCYIIKENAEDYLLDLGEMTGTISKKDSRFTFFTPEKYLSTLQIGTDLKNNPVRLSPENSAKVIELGSDLDWVFEVLEIKGDWMKIQSFNMCENVPEDQFKEFQGWIKFRENGRLLIQEYLSC